MTSNLYTYDAFVVDPETGAWLPLPVLDIRPSVDKDRVPYAIATVNLGPLTGDMLDLLDPRRITVTAEAPVRWRIARYTSDGELIDTYPAEGAWASMWPRTLRRTITEATLTLHGGESLIDDRISLNGIELEIATRPGRIEGAPFPNWANLVQAGLEYVFGDTFNQAVSIDDAAADAMKSAAHFVYDMPVGRSVLDLIETELNALGLRLYDVFGTWWVADRDVAPGAIVTTYGEDGEVTYTRPVVELSSYTSPDLPEGTDAAILDFEETLTRDGDWADGVLVQLTGSDDRYWWNQVATVGLGGGCASASRGRIFDVPFAPESGNLAETLLARTLRKGRDVRITARARLDVIPGMTLRAHLLDETLEAIVSAVDWDIPTGTMTIYTQSAVTLDDEEITSSQDGGTAAATATVAELQQVAASIPTRSDIRFQVHDVIDRNAEQTTLRI